MENPDTHWYTANPKATSFTISTAAELAGLAQIVNGTWGGAPTKDDFSGRTIILAGNIDLSLYNNWIPIGSYGNEKPRAGGPFSGTFDGGGHVISGLTINSPYEVFVGLFGNVANCRVENLGLEGVNIKGDLCVGSVAGCVDKDSVVTNCYSTGAVGGGGEVGGIAGEVGNSSIITNCYSACTVRFIFDESSDEYSTSEGYSIGGVVGRINENSVVVNCYSIGAVSGEATVGGVAGDVNRNCRVIGCAALNPEVKGECSPVKRVAGSIKDAGEGALSKNLAFFGIRYNDEDLHYNYIGEDDLNGQEITAAEIIADGAIGGLFTSNNGWTTENGRLPGLFGKTAAMPKHLIPAETRWYTDAIAANPKETLFKISTADELAALAEIVNGTWGGMPKQDNFSGKTIKLTGNIDLCAHDNWTPIGNYYASEWNVFSGTFDGCGHVISNLTINRPDKDFQGLFGYLEGGSVKNLVFDSVNIHDRDAVGDARLPLYLK